MVTESLPKLVTADELLKLDAQGFYGELIRGVLCEMPPPGNEHGQICLRLGSLIWQFVDIQQLGTATSNDSGIRLERDPDTVRGPDLAFFSKERLSPEIRLTGYSDVLPDLLVEVKSPHDSRDDIHDKALMWLSYGVRLVWVVLPDTRTVDVYRSTRDISTVAGNGELTGGDVLPGFRCDLDQVFGPPPAPPQQPTGDQSAANP